MDHNVKSENGNQKESSSTGTSLSPIFTADLGTQTSKSIKKIKLEKGILRFLDNRRGREDFFINGNLYLFSVRFHKAHSARSIRFYFLHGSLLDFGNSFKN